jgi:class 3 adenylate cyclase
MGSNNRNNTYSRNKISLSSAASAIAPFEIVDAQTLVTQTQDRMWKALEGRYLYDSSLKDSQTFLLNHVNSKISLVIMYVDLVGSTNMSMALPVDKMVTIIRAFTYEMTCIVRSYGGYVLKYVGDAIIALFPAEYNSSEASKNALNCAKGMLEIIKKCINPELSSRHLPEISVKMSSDYGHVQVVLYGKSIDRSHIDIVGSSISMAAKMIPLAQSWQILIGQSMYEKLDNKQDFVEMNLDPTRWTYVDEKRGSSYKLYALT